MHSQVCGKGTMVTNSATVETFLHVENSAQAFLPQRRDGRAVGDTGIIRARGRWIITSCGCGRSWRKIRRILCTSAQYTVRVTSLCRSGGLKVDDPLVETRLAASRHCRAAGDGASPVSTADSKRMR